MTLGRSSRASGRSPSRRRAPAAAAARASFVGAPSGTNSRPLVLGECRASWRGARLTHRLPRPEETPSNYPHHRESTMTQFAIIVDVSLALGVRTALRATVVGV